MAIRDEPSLSRPVHITKSQSCLSERRLDTDIFVKLLNQILHWDL